MLKIIQQKVLKGVHLSVTIKKIQAGVEATIGKTVETDKIIGVMTLDRDIEIGVKVGIGPEIIAVTEQGAEIEVETEMDKCEIDPELCQMTEEDQGPDPTLEQTQTGTD